MKYVKEKGWLEEDGTVGFADELNWIWFELWHHEGRRVRHGAAMMGPDYTHWHGGYEVAKHFYTKFLPKIEHLADEHGDEVLKQKIADLLALPEHEWRDGQDREEAHRIRARYREYYEMPRPGAEGN